MTSAERLARAAVTAAFALGTVPSQAAESAVGAFAGVSYLHTDNVAFSAEDARSDDIAELTVGLNFVRSQPRMDTSVSYQLEDYNYDENDEADQTFHQVDARTTIELAADRLFVDMFGVHNQTNLDPNGTYSFSNFGLTQNRGDFTLVGGSPALTLGWGDNVVGEIRQGYSKLDYRDGDAEDSVERFARFGLGNPNVRSGMTWSTTYVREQYEYELSDEVELENFEVELGRWFGAARVFTQQGLEPDYEEQAASGEFTAGLDSHYWYAGVQWRPDDRTDISVAVGDRNFGTATRFTMSRRVLDGAVSIGYLEEPSSSLREQLISARRVGELTPIDSLDRGRPNVLFITERLDAAFSIERPKSSGGFRIYTEKRFDVTQDLGDTERERLRGAELAFVWRFHVRTALGVSAQEVRRRSDLNSVDDDTRYTTMTLTRRLGQRTDLSLAVSRQESRTRSDDPLFAPYEQNVAIVQVRRQFGTAQRGADMQRLGGQANAGFSR